MGIHTFLVKPHVTRPSIVAQAVEHELQLTKKDVPFFQGQYGVFVPIIAQLRQALLAEMKNPHPYSALPLPEDFYQPFKRTHDPHFIYNPGTDQWLLVSHNQGYAIAQFRNNEISSANVETHPLLQEAQKIQRRGIQYLVDKLGSRYHIIATPAAITESEVSELEDMVNTPRKPSNAEEFFSHVLTFYQDRAPTKSTRANSDYRRSIAAAS